MREIKFRVWDKRRGRMRFGNDNLMISLSGHLFWDVGYKEPDMLGEDESQDYILLEYTGLKDKNGVEIYGGDVVRIEDGDFEVCVLENCWYLRCVTLGRTSFGRLWEVSVEARSKSLPFDVIGNICENPELSET